jgi:hypothetical protein
MPPRETLAVTSSWSKPEALAAHEILAHPRAIFYLCTCGLYGDAAVVVVTLIGYNDVEIVVETITRKS